MESKGAAKRKKIFHKYSKQLHKLVELGLLPIKLKFESTYVCPICIRQFSENDLDLNLNNHLTLENAPPKSLGGRARTLTCKECNNRFGEQIDFHLSDKLAEMEIRSFLPNTGVSVKLLHNGVRVQGTINVSDEGIITITHLKKVNNPPNLKKYVSQTGKDDIINVEFPASRVELKGNSMRKPKEKLS